MAVSLYLFRQRLQSGRPSNDIAAPGIDYYRRELERRRRHLRNAWIWHGPLLLSVIFLIGALLSTSFPGLDRLPGVLPLLILLIAWTAFSLHRRYRLIKEVQKEIDEIEQP